MYKNSVATSLKNMKKIMDCYRPLLRYHDDPEEFESIYNNLENDNIDKVQ